MRRRDFIQRSAIAGASLFLPRISIASFAETEVLAKRTFTAKHFQIAENQMRMAAHIGQLHYRDGALKDGAFRDIDTTLNFSASKYAMNKASYEAEITTRGAVTYYNVDHSLTMKLANANAVDAQSYLGSEWGRLGKALIWRNILQDGGHQIVECRNGSLAKIMRFEKKPLSNVITFEVSFSSDLRLGDFAGANAVELSPVSGFTVSGKHLNFRKGTGSRISWLRKPTAWNHREERVDITLRFYRSGSKFYVEKIIPQAFIDKTFTEAGAWLETDTTTSYYAGAGDGHYIRDEVSETFNTLRSGAQTAYSIDGSYIILSLTAAGEGSDDQYTSLYRAVLPIDTSGLTSGATISSANLKLFVASAMHSTFETTPTVATDLYTTAGYALANYAVVRQVTTDWPGTSDSNLALNATGLSNISKTGTTKLALRLSWDFDNSAPTWVASAHVSGTIFSSEYGGAYVPYLSVTYTLASSARKRPATIVIY